MDVELIPRNRRQETEPNLEVVISPRSPWASISYVQDRHVLGTTLGCNNNDWVQE